MRKQDDPSDEEQRYHTLIERLTIYAHEQPERYRRRVAVLAVVGYAYVLAMLAILVSLLAVTVFLLFHGGLNGLTIRFGIFMLAFVWIVVRALWVTIPRPEGIPLTPTSVPELFRMLNQTTQALDAPKFHHVLLTDDFNAGVQQVPRLGIFGAYRNYLVLGLPLMAALTPEQMQAVIAHEVGHLSGSHSRFSNWIYRVRQTWMSLLEDLGRRRHRGAFLFRKFFGWYAPYFSAYSFVLARSEEYVADRCAVEIAGSQAIASALLNIEVRGRYLNEEFWPGLMKQAQKMPKPPAGPFGVIVRNFQQDLPRERSLKWADQAMGERTDLFDTHPALADRLEAIGYRPIDGQNVTASSLLLVAAPNTEAAAQRFLGDQLPALIADLEARWHEIVAPIWTQQHEQSVETARQLAELERRVQAGETLTREEELRRAEATMEIVGEAEAIPLYAAIVAAHPENAEAQFALGYLRLQQEDETGISNLESAMALEPGCTFPACDAIYGFLKRAARYDEAEAYRKRALKRSDIEEMAQAERSTLSPADKFLPADLAEDVLARLREQLSQATGINAVYIVRKDVQYLPEHPLYVVAIEPRIPQLKFRLPGAATELCTQIGNVIELPGHFVVVSLEDDNASLRGPIRKAQRKPFYKR